MLVFLFDPIGNFGVAIICLTLIVRGIMFPIAQKQFQSMAAMRKVQPKLKAIQERFKDDSEAAAGNPEALSVGEDQSGRGLPSDPASDSGLLRALQGPAGVGRNAAPTVRAVDQGLVGRRPADTGQPVRPAPFHAADDACIGVLPILVGATQWLSMKLNPQPMDPAQAQIFAIMPWFLVFVMAPFAAGLQLYWITNNVLTIAQQWWLYRNYGLHLSDTHPVHT